MDRRSLTCLNLKSRSGLLQYCLVSLAMAQLVPPAPLRAEVDLSLPKYRLAADELAVVVNDRDPLSVRIGEYYLRARGLPQENLLHLAFDPQRGSLTPAVFRPLREELLRNTPQRIQAYALTWRSPYRVGCMSMTSAITFGFDKAWCSAYRCATTRHSPYYDYPGANPIEDLTLRPSMLIAAENFTDAKDLIDRGLAADASLPRGTAYLVNTRDKQRGVRAFDYPRIKLLMEGWIDSEIIDQEALRNRDDVLFYFTGTTRVPGLETLGIRPGAIADHLTSAGGQLLKSRQMSALEWLKAGASGSYGTVVEPCNHLGKFPSPALVMEHYGSGSTLIEAYWKSVQQPGEGLFIGDPLAAPFDHVEITQTDQGTKLLTRNLKPGRYQLAQAPSPIGPFKPVSNLVIGYHQTEFSLPMMAEGFYRLRLHGKYTTSH